MTPRALAARLAHDVDHAVAARKPHLKAKLRFRFHPVRSFADDGGSGSFDVRAELPGRVRREPTPPLVASASTAPRCPNCLNTSVPKQSRKVSTEALRAALDEDGSPREAVQAAELSQCIPGYPA